MIQRDWLYEITDDTNLKQGQDDSVNLNPIIACTLNNDFHIFMDNSIKDVQEILLAETFDRIKGIYIPGLYKWLEENNAELTNEMIEIEKGLNEFDLNEHNYNGYKYLLENYKSLYEKAIAAYKAKSKDKD